MTRLRLAGITRALALPLSRRTRSLLERVRRSLLGELHPPKPEPIGEPEAEVWPELDDEEARIERLLDEEALEVARLSNEAVLILQSRVPGIRPRVLFRAGTQEISTSGRLTARFVAKLRLESRHASRRQD